MHTIGGKKNEEVENLEAKKRKAKMRSDSRNLCKIQI
jgi:hypothetical protein